jgi:DNA polymerase
MSIITIDFESYYDKEYSLSKMTTEEYINDPRFEVIGVGIKYDDLPSEWYAGDDAASALYDLSCHASEHAILCHNTLFDGAILSWKYGIKPGMWFDTLCMARALHGTEVSGSLKALVERYKLGVKGNEVHDAIGKKLVDFDQVSLERYGVYCCNDVDLTYRLFQRLSQDFPDSEYQLIDLTLRMYTQPTLESDSLLLTDKLGEVRALKSTTLSKLIEVTGVADEEAVRQILASNPKFAKILKGLNVTIPMKVSPATGKDTYALAKNDEGFIQLLEHPDPTVQELCRVRLGTKSTIEESRIARFIGVATRNYGLIPVPLKYYGAHTGRWSGMDGVNFQNLPSRDKAKKTLKNAIMAPVGHLIINSDSSQIEARVLAWLADQKDLVESFAKGEDVYSTFASKVYDRPISKKDVIERFVGKICQLGLGYGTGATKLQSTLKLGGADLTVEKCKEIVDLYRSTNDRIPVLWRRCDNALSSMMQGQSATIGVKGLIEVNKDGIRLPNGLHIRYNNLRLDEGGRPLYDSRKGPVNIWGGAMVENIVQALARNVIGDQMRWISKYYRPVLTVHDALVYVVPEADIEQAMEFITLCMSTPPAWAEGLPVACEAKQGRTYGDC